MNAALSMAPTTPPLILSIDESEIALRARSLLLSSEGYSVLTASSGGDGLELFKQYPIELVIADYFLAAVTGAELAREMKELKPDVPILILSIPTYEPDSFWFADVCLEFVDVFLLKGGPPKVLLDTIAHLLAK